MLLGCSRWSRIGSSADAFFDAFGSFRRDPMRFGAKDALDKQEAFQLDLTQRFSFNVATFRPHTFEALL
jgi:hypothetical protein